MPQGDDVTQRRLSAGDVPQQRAQPLWIDGLGEIVVGAFFHRRHGGIDAALGGDEDESEIAELILDAAQELQAVDPRHDHVGQHRRGPVCGDALEAFLAVCRAFGLVTPRPHQFGQSPPGGDIVFDNEHSHSMSGYRKDAGGMERWGESGGPRGGTRRRCVLRENTNDDAAVLSAALSGVVRARGLVFAVADDVHLVQRHLMRVVEIALHGLSARFADTLIDHLVAARIGVAFDLDEVAAWISLELRDQLVDPRLDAFRQLSRPELELAPVFADHDFVDEALRRGFDGVDLATRRSPRPAEPSWPTSVRPWPRCRPGRPWRRPA